MKKAQNKRIVFILPSLKAGGAERVISYISLKLNQEQFNITLIVLGFEKDKVYDTGDLNIIYLNNKRLLNSVFDLIKTFIKIKPSIVFSSIVHVNILMGLFSIFFSKVKFIAREASVVSKRNEFSKSKIRIISLLIKNLYPRLDVIVCQSTDMKKDFIDNFNIDERKIHVINNPITNEIPIEKTFHKNKDIIKFITVGRLSKEKGHKRILEILAQIKSYNYLYTIIGSGPELEIIRNLIKELKITDNVILIPYSKNILSHLSKHDLFLQGSYVEGFPNALLESCSVGTPVLAFNAPGGTKEIVEDGINGFLVEDEMEFSNKLRDIRKLKSLDRNEVESSVTNKFNSKKIVNQYRELINSI